MATLIDRKQQRSGIHLISFTPLTFDGCLTKRIRGRV